MSSSIGRLALGVVGALIGSAFGVPGIGFAIGSAIGGFLFPPEGPTVEGPRIGDTDVTASSLGKIIPQHYGVTRSSANIFWSAGLKEVKVTEEVGGGKGGGPSQTNISYEYFASFAAAFGRGPAVDVLRIWADGKLVYDVTGSGTQGGVDNGAPTFNFRFITGGPNTTVDPLIAESINRRLAGLPDVNEGNGPQSTYRTIDDLIAETSASADPRSAIYTTYLNQLKSNAETAGGTPPDYMFTPAYKEFCYIVFDDLPLADFGNRIPNITAEIVWSNDGSVDINNTVAEGAMSELSADTSAPISGMGVDTNSRSVLVKNNTRIRRFSATSATETLDASATQTVTAQPEDPGQMAKSVNSTVEDVLCADASGDFIVRLSRTGETTDPIIAKVSNTSLDIIGDAVGESSWYAFTPLTMDSGAAAVTFATNAGQNGSRKLVAGVNPSGNLYIFEVASDRVTVVWGTATGQTFTGVGDGPMTYAGGGSGDINVYWIGDNGTNWSLYEVNVKFGTTGVPTVTVKTLESGTVANADPRALVYDFSTQMLNAFFEKGGAGLIAQYDPNADGSASDPYLQYDQDLTLQPPGKKSGLTRSLMTGGKMAYAAGNDACIVDAADGSEVVYTNVLSGTASTLTQVYLGSAGTLYTWIGTTPTTVVFSRLSTSLYSTDLASVISDICTRSGMAADEYDVSDIAGKFEVRGYTIARPSSGRKSLENLLMAYFVDGVETDWTVKFQERSTTPVRTITEDELGAVKGPTGDVRLLEARQPEYDLPAELAMIYIDQDRDYQQGSAHYRRVSNPSPIMYSKKTQNIEMPLVMLEPEARDVAQRLMFLAWMSRDSSKVRLPWTHADLDPADVVSFVFDDGRTLTDRVATLGMGANFELELQANRSGDPVYTKQVAPQISSSNVPSNGVQTPVFSKMFVFDIPLLYDYHDTGRISSRYYTAVGSDTTSFINAGLYQSLDGANYTNFDTATVDITWGQVVGSALPPPRALWTLDTDNTLTVALSVDNGNVNSVTYDQILNEEANLALIWNQTTGVGELIQFQDVVDNGNGTVTLSNLVRGRRGTDYAVEEHQSGEFFILMRESALQTQTQALALIGSTQYFKAVSRGSTIGSAPQVSTEFTARDLKPYAPSNVRRSDNGSDLTVTWNRRTRIGGEWNMYGTGVETLPLNEDYEEYQFFILPNSADPFTAFDPNDSGTYLDQRVVTSETTTITAADLGVFGYALADTFNCVVYQVSAQIGRGFPRNAPLAA